MITKFDSRRGLVIIPARIAGARGRRLARLALDTGATQTTVRTALLVELGYDPAASSDRFAMTTASGIEYVPRVVVGRFEALGEAREPFVDVAHTLPPSATVDGLLGLDFFRDRRLALDFRSGEITLE